MCSNGALGNRGPCRSGSLVREGNRALIDFVCSWALVVVGVICCPESLLETESLLDMIITHTKPGNGTLITVVRHYASSILLHGHIFCFVSFLLCLRRPH